MTVELIDHEKLIGMNEEAGYRLTFGTASAGEGARSEGRDLSAEKRPAPPQRPAGPLVVRHPDLRVMVRVAIHRPVAGRKQSGVPTDPPPSMKMWLNLMHSTSSWERNSLACSWGDRSVSMGEAINSRRS
jgi:hypothetical protein